MFPNFGNFGMNPMNMPNQTGNPPNMLPNQGNRSVSIFLLALLHLFYSI